MKTETWVRLASIGICTVTGGAAAYVLLRYFSGILLPFAAAALVAAALRPAAERLRARTRIPEKAGGALLIAGAAALLSLGLFAIGEYAYDGARSMIASMLDGLQDGTGPLAGLSALSGRLRRSIPAQHGSLYSMLSDMLREAAQTASAALTGAAASAIARLPRALLSLAVFVIALFYLYFDRGALTGQLRFFCSEKTVTRLRSLFARVREALGSCIRSYLLLSFLVFAELLAGFLLLNIENAPLAALLTALVDLLPVFGVGTVLIPWSILAFLSGDVFRGTGLLILFGVMYAVRQFAEPRIVGGTIGVHPLWALLAVFAGFRLFGVGGMLLAPALLYIGKAALAELAPVSGAAAPEAAGGQPDGGKAG